MNGINQADMKMLATVIFWALHYDKVTTNLMVLHFNCKEEFAQASLVALHGLGVINRSNPNDENEPWTVMINDIGDINSDMLNILQMNGFTIKQISDALKGLPTEKKKVASNILTDRTHTWFDLDKTKPEEDKLYLIRLCNKNKIFIESRTEIVYIEDIKIAKFVNNEWSIEGPFPLYDFSPCSKMESINDGCIVTHFAEVNEKEIDQWHHRFDPHHKYDSLKIYVDDDNIEDFYRALIIASSCISKEAINYPEDHEVRIKLEEAYKYICDMQTALDRGGNINHAMDKK